MVLPLLTDAGRCHSQIQPKQATALQNQAKQVTTLPALTIRLLIHGWHPMRGEEIEERQTRHRVKKCSPPGQYEFQPAPHFP